MARKKKVVKEVVKISNCSGQVICSVYKNSEGKNIDLRLLVNEIKELDKNELVYLAKFYNKGLIKIIK
jgi:hypothetical protein